MTLAATLNSFASSLSTTMVRPLMPPAALHHLGKSIGYVEELLLQAWCRGRARVSRDADVDLGSR